MFVEVKRAYNDRGVYIEAWFINGNVKEEYEIEIEESEVFIEYEVYVGTEKKVEVELRLVDPNTYREFAHFLEELRYATDSTVAQKLSKLVNTILNTDVVKQTVQVV